MTELNPDAYIIPLPNGLTEDDFPAYFGDTVEEIGRASCRERV